MTDEEFLTWLEKQPDRPMLPDVLTRVERLLNPGSTHEYSHPFHLQQAPFALVQYIRDRMVARVANTLK